MVIAGTACGSPAFTHRPARRVLARARLQHLAEDDLADPPAGLGAREQFVDDRGASSGAGVGKRAAELADRGWAAATMTMSVLMERSPAMERNC